MLRINTESEQADQTGCLCMINGVKYLVKDAYWTAIKTHTCPLMLSLFLEPPTPATVPLLSANLLTVPDSGPIVGASWYWGRGWSNSGPCGHGSHPRRQRCCVWHAPLWLWRSPPDRWAPGCLERRNCWRWKCPFGFRIEYGAWKSSANEDFSQIPASLHQYLLPPPTSQQVAAAITPPGLWVSASSIAIEGNLATSMP